MKKLAIFDIDGVIYDGHTIFDQIQNQENGGIIEKGTWNKILVELGDYKSGKKTYKQAADNMLGIYAVALSGRDYQEVVVDTVKFFSSNKNKFFAYFEKVIPEIENKYDIFFVSTNFQFVCEALGKIFAIDKYLSSIAEVKNDKFSGKVALSLGGNKGIVSGLISKYGKEGSFAVGDSENDVDMLEKVEFPFVMEPNEKMMKIASEKKWQIVNRDNIKENLLRLV